MQPTYTIGDYLLDRLVDCGIQYSTYLHERRVRICTRLIPLAIICWIVS